MTTFAVQREDGFDFRSAEYDDMYSRAGATPFQHGVWLTTLYEVLAPRRRAEKVVVTVREAGGRLVLVLPLVRRRQGPLRVLEYADLGVNDYAAPVLDQETLPALVADRQLGRQIRSALGGFDLLRIERVADSPELFLSLLAGAHAKPHSYDTHLIDLTDTVEEWHGRLDPHFVRHLERKYKRLRPKGERRLRLVEDPAEVDPLMDRLRQFRAARFADRRGVDLVQDDDCFEFYRTAARRSVTEGGPGRLVALEVAGEPVSVAFDLTDDKQELYLLVGYDVERLRNYSLGLLIVDELVRDAIERGIRGFDLTVGDESYKTDFGARARPLYEIRLRRTPIGAVGFLARDGYLRARRTAKRIVIAREERQKEKQRARQQQEKQTPEPAAKEPGQQDRGEKQKTHQGPRPKAD